MRINLFYSLLCIHAIVTQRGKNDTLSDVMLFSEMEIIDKIEITQWSQWQSQNVSTNDANNHTKIKKCAKEDRMRRYNKKYYTFIDMEIY